MIIPAVGSENTVVKTDATGKIQPENKDGENLLSFIREVRQILEIPAIQNMIGKNAPKQQQQKTEQDQQQDKQETETEDTGFDPSMLMKILSSKKGCIQFAQGLDLVILSFGDNKLSEFRDLILKQAGVDLSEYQALQNETPEFKEVKDDEIESS